MKTKTTTTDERPILERALAAVPGLAEAQEALERVKVYRRTATLPSTGVDRDVLTEVAGAVSGGGPVPNDLSRQVADAQRAVAERMADAKAYEALQQILGQQVGSALAQGRDAALGVVAAELDDVMAETREVAEVLGSATSAEQAMDAGPAATEAWRDLRRLLDRYDSLGAAQRQLVGPEVGGGGPQTMDALYVAGWLENQEAEVDPDLRREIMARSSEDGPGVSAQSAAMAGAGWARLDGPTWPAPVLERTWWPTMDRPAYLLWLATGPARPWVPTVPELKAKQAEVARLVALGLPPAPETPHGVDRRAFVREQRDRQQAIWADEDMAEANRRAGGIR